MRNVLDKKRHYKKNDSSALPKYFQIGTVVEGSADFYSSRIPKRQRKTNMIDELLADAEFRRYNKKKYLEIQAAKQSGKKGFYKKKKNKRKPTSMRSWGCDCDLNTFFTDTMGHFSNIYPLLTCQ